MTGSLAGKVWHVCSVTPIGRVFLRSCESILLYVAQADSNAEQIVLLNFTSEVLRQVLCTYTHYLSRTCHMPVKDLAHTRQAFCQA